MRVSVLLFGVLALLFLSTEAGAQGGRVGVVLVHGHVADEAGAPIAGATISVSTEMRHYPSLTTDASGDFVARVRPTPALRLAASHPSYGEQWTDPGWNAWSRYDAIPATPVVLTLRRGVVVRGRLRDEAGSPRAHERLLLIPAYVGSGPHPLEATTDAAGDFAFPRAVLDSFEIVARSLDHWHPERGSHAGDFVRIAQDAPGWLAHARADQPIEIRLGTLRLAAVELAVTRAGGAPVARTDVDVWLRTSPSAWLGTQRRTDAHGHCRVLMEPGVAYELWVSEPPAVHAPPWSGGGTSPPSWRGTVDGATTLPVVLPPSP